MDILKQYVIALLTTAFTLFALALFVYFRDRKNKINRTYVFFTLSAFLWSFGEALLVIAPSKEIAIFWNYVCNFGIFLIATGYVHFTLAFLGIDNEKSKKKVIVISYIFSLLAVILLATKIFLPPPVPKFSLNYFIEPGPVIYFLFVLFWLAQVSYGLSQLFKAYVHSSGLRRNQIKYLLIGTLIGFLGGSGNYFLTFNMEIFPINPFGTYGVVIFSVMMAYAIVRYRLMDINLVLTRAGIFLLVYALVLGIPFWIGFKYDLWKYSTWIMLFLATLGPLIYNYFRRRAEARMRAEEFHARELLTQAAEGMMRFRSTKKLASLIVHVTCKTLKLDNAAMLLVDEVTGKYNLEVVRLKSKYQYLESLDNNDALIQRLSTIDDPLVYEEVKLQSQELKNKPDDPIHEIERQMQALSAAVVIPASSRGRLLGFLVLGEKKSKRMYSQDDLSVLWALSYQAALAIENARFHQKAQEELLREDREVTSRFIGHGASHQFGNLLHRIIQRSEGKEMDLEEMDLNTLSPEDLKKLVLQLKDEFSAITKTAFQGKDIVSGILSLGSGSPVEFKEEDLRAIITTAVSTIKLKQSKKTIQDMAQVTEIVTQITDNLPKIYCNSMQLEQVLDNLLDNDLEAIEEKDNLIKRGELKEDNFRGRITIETTLENDRILIRLSDNGIGIRPEDLNRVFMPFFTTKATERLSRKGHGIGMHMVKEIIKAHQGKIYIDKTEYTKGTTFVMELPLKVSENKKI